jgi:histidyl-tRNA synthetase
MSKESILPPAGTRDIEPSAAEIRNDTVYKITSSYKKYGFHSIETPSLEKLENLIGKKGGENEKLIFKVLKRGEELKEAMTSAAAGENDIADFGLRYDLTVPLARYYAHYKDKLPKPFKVFQIGNVWRAERPQKGRYRQFTQCDIDIIGDSTANCETELIYVTCKTLADLGIKNFEIRINDRAILKQISKECGICDDEQYRDFLIALDKLDKKSLDEVLQELKNKNFSAQALEKTRERFQKYISQKKEGNAVDLDAFSLLETQGENNPAFENLKRIISDIRNLLGSAEIIRFDPTLVRGMDYYTGTIYEVSEINGHMSFGGGGRYNNMVGSFSGQDIPACGFSLGFERIIDSFFSNSGTAEGKAKKKAALLYSSGQDNYPEIMKYAESMSEDYAVVSVFDRQKNLSNQLNKLKEIGFTHWGFYKGSGTVVNEMDK